MSRPSSQPAVEQVAFTGLDRQGKQVFLGLMLGMFVASLSQTIVGPGLPRIVADLGGMAHYSWIATAAMLASAVTVPVAGKLSDLYGRRPFYIGGLAIFLVGAAMAGASTSFWFLVVSRAIQGVGMGILMPLSQTIVGDIIPPRQRGKYQGLMGAVFGVTSIIGPLIGGAVTDLLGWRWLFYLTLPLGVIALIVMVRSFHVQHTPRKVVIDWPGMTTLIPGLVVGLLALSWGGNTYAWASPTILVMGAISVALLVAFVLIELRAEEPLIPLSMLGRYNIAVSVLASFFIAVAMFGAIIYVPVYAQAVLGVSATESGMILIPQSVAMIGMSILAGLLITKTGRYKSIIVTGGIALAIGFGLMATLGYGSHAALVTVSMIVIGIGLGMVMQTYTLVVQNEVPMHQLGVGTAAVQFFRNVGSTIGIAVLGTVMSSRMSGDIAAHLPDGASANLPTEEGSGAAAALDPAALAQLPPEIVEAVRMGLGDTMHAVFLTALPFALIAAILGFFIRPKPLRDTLQRAARTTTTGSMEALTEEQIHEADPDSGDQADKSTGGRREHVEK